MLKFSLYVFAFVIIAIFALGGVYANAGNAGIMHAKAKMMPHRVMHARAKMIRRKRLAIGKKLFYSKRLGTTGLSCATCHVYSAGTYIKMHGINMIIRPLKNVRQIIRTFDKMHHAHLTVKKKIEMCLRFNLKNTSITRRQLRALTAYVVSLR